MSCVAINTPLVPVFKFYLGGNLRVRVNIPAGYFMNLKTAHKDNDDDDESRLVIEIYDGCGTRPECTAGVFRNIFDESEFGRASWKHDYLITASFGNDHDDVITFIA